MEQWAERNANKASPDGMIAAVIVESLAKNWQDWTASDLREAKANTRWVKAELSPKLVNKKKNITVEFGVRRWTQEINGYNCTMADWQSKGTKVNGVEIELKASRYIAREYERLAKVHKLANETAARVEADMKKNKEKWDLAEKLLGFKRTETGALVPIHTAEEATA